MLVVHKVSLVPLEWAPQVLRAHKDPLEPRASPAIKVPLAHKDPQDHKDHKVM